MRFSACAAGLLAALLGPALPLDAWADSVELVGCVYVLENPCGVGGGTNGSTNVINTAHEGWASDGGAPEWAPTGCKAAPLWPSTRRNGPEEYTRSSRL